MITRNHFVGNHLHVPPILLISLHCLITNIPRNNDFLQSFMRKNMYGVCIFPQYPQTFHICWFILVNDI